MESELQGDVIIRWRSGVHPATKAKIRQRFGIPDYESVNGWNPCSIKPVDWPLFEETSARGYYAIMRKKWCKKGGQFIF